LKLLEEISSILSRSYILLILAHRHDEAAAASAVPVTLQRIERGGASLLRVDLEPLGEGDIDTLLGDLSLARGEERRSFSRVVLARTAGNPFFVRTFLKELHADGALRFERSGLYVDPARAQAAGAADSIVALLLERVRKLSPDAQQLLV